MSHATEGARLAGDLTTEDVGSMILDVPGIDGWASNLLLRAVERDGERLRLDFRWNDSPAPQNTQRGQFAIGVYVEPSTPVRVYPPGEASA